MFAVETFDCELVSIEILYKGHDIASRLTIPSPFVKLHHYEACSMTLHNIQLCFFSLTLHLWFSLLRKDCDFEHFSETTQIQSLDNTVTYSTEFMMMLEQ